MQAVKGKEPILPLFYIIFISQQEGMNWLQARYLKKYNLDISMISSSRELSDLQARFLASKEDMFYPIILKNQEEMIMHVTPCVFLKNEKGIFFLHLDSMGRAGSVLSYKQIKDVLDPSVVMIVNQEQRQRDGFSCRVDSFVMLKKLKQSFDVNHSLNETDVFQNINASSEHAGIYEGVIRGAFMMSAQIIVSDARKEERVFGTSCTLQEMQNHFSARYFRTLTQMTHEQTALLSSSVYLQCKALKFVEECHKQIESEENRYKGMEFRTDADF